MGERDFLIFEATRLLGSPYKNSVINLESFVDTNNTTYIAFYFVFHLFLSFPFLQVLSIAVP